MTWEMPDRQWLLVTTFAVLTATGCATRHAQTTQPCVPVEPPVSIDYRVQPGETVEHIASLFVLTPEDIRYANKIESGQQITPGTVIQIPRESMKK